MHLHFASLLRSTNKLKKRERKKETNWSAFGCVIEAGMAPKQPNSGLFVGLNKGHVVTKKELAPRPSDRKGVS